MDSSEINTASVEGLNKETETPALPEWFSDAPDNTTKNEATPALPDWFQEDSAAEPPTPGWFVSSEQNARKSLGASLAARFGRGLTGVTYDLVSGLVSADPLSFLGPLNPTKITDWAVNTATGMKDWRRETADQIRAQRDRETAQYDPYVRAPGGAIERTVGGALESGASLVPTLAFGSMGAIPSAYALAAEDARRTAREVARENGRPLSTDMEDLLATTGGIAGAGLESMFPGVNKMLMKALGKKVIADTSEEGIKQLGKSVVKEAMQGMLHGLWSEPIQEMTEEITNDSARILAGLQDKVDWSKYPDIALQSALIGAIGGGAIEGASQADFKKASVDAARKTLANDGPVLKGVQAMANLGSKDAQDMLTHWHDQAHYVLDKWGEPDANKERAAQYEARAAAGEVVTKERDLASELDRLQMSEAAAASEEAANLSIAEAEALFSKEETPTPSAPTNVGEVLGGERGIKPGTILGGERGLAPGTVLGGERGTAPAPNGNPVQLTEGPITDAAYGRQMDAFDAFANVPKPATPLENTTTPQQPRAEAGQNGQLPTSVAPTSEAAGSSVPVETPRLEATPVAEQVAQTSTNPAVAPAPNELELQSALNAEGDNGVVVFKRGANPVTAAIAIRPTNPGAGEPPNHLQIDSLGSIEKGGGRDVFLQAAKYAISQGKGLSWSSTPEAVGFYKKLGFSPSHAGTTKFSATAQALEQLVSSTKSESVTQSNANPPTAAAQTNPTEGAAAPSASDLEEWVKFAHPDAFETTSAMSEKERTATRLALWEKAGRPDLAETEEPVGTKVEVSRPNGIDDREGISLLARGIVDATGAKLSGEERKAAEQVARDQVSSMVAGSNDRNANVSDEGFSRAYSKLLQFAQTNGRVPTKSEFNSFLSARRHTFDAFRTEARRQDLAPTTSIEEQVVEKPTEQKQSRGNALHQAFSDAVPETVATVQEEFPEATELDVLHVIRAIWSSRAKRTRDEPLPTFLTFKSDGTKLNLNRPTALSQDADFREAVSLSLRDTLRRGEVASAQAPGRTGRTDRRAASKPARADGQTRSGIEKSGGSGLDSKGLAELTAAIRLNPVKSQRLAELHEGWGYGLTPGQMWYDENAAAEDLLTPAASRVYSGNRDGFGLDGQTLDKVLRTAASMKTTPPELKTFFEHVLARHGGWLSGTKAYAMWSRTAVAGVYNQSVGINALQSSEGVARSLAHEVSHVILQGKYKAFLDGEHSRLSESDLSALRDLETLRTTALQSAPDWLQAAALNGDYAKAKREFDKGILSLPNEQRAEAVSNYYGLLHPVEFVPEAMSNAKFQAFLSTITAPKVKKQTVWEKIKAAFKKLVAGREVAKGSVLDAAIERSFDVLSNAPLPDKTAAVFSFAPQYDEQPIIRNTTAMKRWVPYLSEPTQKAMTSKTYVGVRMNDLDNKAHAYIESVGDPVQAFYNTFAEVTTMSEAEATAVRFMSVIKMKELTERAKSEDVPQFVLDEIIDATTDMTARLQEQLSPWGQVGAVAAHFANVIDPIDTVKAGYIKPFTDRQKALRNNETAQKIKGALDASKTEAAQGTTDKLRDLFKKALKAGDSAGVRSDIDALFDALFPNTGVQTGPLPVVEEIKNALVRQFKKQLESTGEKADPKFFDLLSNAVRSSVSSQFEQAKVEKPEATEEQLLSRIGDVLQNGVLAEDVFNRLGTGGRFDLSKVRELTKSIGQLVQFKDEITKSLADRAVSKERLVGAVRQANPWLSEEQANKLGEAIRKNYDVQVAKAAKAKLDALVASDAKVREALDVPTMQRLLNYVNAGALSNEVYYNTIAHRFNLPSYDPDFAKYVTDTANAIQRETLPGSIIRGERLQKLMAEVGAKHLAQKNLLARAVQLGSAIWTAGVLSGPPTQAVNAVATQASVGLELMMKATGHYIASRKAGHSHAESAEFFKDIARAYKAIVAPDGGIRNSKGALEAWASLTKGTNRAKSETLEAQSLLEAYDPAKGNAGQRYLGLLKYVGRAMLAADSYNSTIASEAASIMQSRAAALENPDLLKGKSFEDYMFEITNGGFVAEAKQTMSEQEERGELKGMSPTDKQRHLLHLIDQLRFSNQTREDGAAFAAKATFNETPYGVLGYLLDTTFGELNKSIGVSRLLVPFPKTLANIINAAINYSPVGFLRAKNLTPSHFIAEMHSEKSTRGKQLREYTRKIDPNSEEYYTMQARAALGTGLWMLLAAAAEAGLDDKDPYFSVTGTGPADYAKRKAAEQSGKWTPNTVKIGNLKLRYSDWPGLSLILGHIGTMSDYKRFGEDDSSFATRSMMAVLGSAGVLVSKNMLAGLSDFMDIMQNPDQASVKIRKMSGAAISGFSHPQAIKFAEQSLFGTVPDQTSAEGWLLGLFPVAPYVAGKPMLNLLGEPIVNLPWEPLTRRFGDLNEIVKPHPVLTPLYSAGLYVPLGKRGAIRERGVERKMTDAEAYRYAEVYGKTMKRLLTPDAVQNLVRMAGKDKDAAQKVLTTQFGGTARATALNTLLRDARP